MSTMYVCANQQNTLVHVSTDSATNLPIFAGFTG